MREIKACLQEKFVQMPTEELDAILQAELRKEQPDEEVVLSILRVLEEREKDFPVEASEEVLTLAKKLSEHKAPQKRHSHRSWILGVAAAAAALCIVVMALPRAVGAENVRDMIHRLTNSIIEFFDPNRGETPQTEVNFVTDNPGLQQIYDEIIKLGVTEPVVPMWLPEGCQLLKLDMMPLPDGHKIAAVFQAGENTITLSYRIKTEKVPQFETGEAGAEYFEFGGKMHTIVGNAENLSVRWNADRVECSLNATFAREDVYKSIKSIYRSDLS